jgi:hypothetical protein
MTITYRHECELVNANIINKRLDGTDKVVKEKRRDVDGGMNCEI